MRIKAKRTRKSRVIVPIIGVIGLLIIGIVAAIWYFYQSNQPSNETLYGSNRTNPTKNTPVASSNNTGSSSNSKTNNPDGSTAPVNVDPAVSPRTPTGVFVSHHKPNLSGSPVSNSLSSTCVTTPGVLCTIQFKKDGVVKELPVKQVDGDGNAYWTWSLQNIGLTQGAWTVSAVAKNNNLTATANDAVPLMVEP